MKKIIVVDPDKKFWKKVEQVVNTDICEVVFLETGQSLMGKLKEESFDLIILNLELPDKNGFIFCNQIKKNSQLKNIPIIITSNEKTESDFEQHKKLKVRAQEYLKKPISLTKIKNTIKSFLPDIILESRQTKTKQNEKEPDVIVEDFDEKNIDKLLDETFVGLIEEQPEEKKEEIENEDTNSLKQRIDSLLEENLTLKQQIEELQQGGSAEKMLQSENEKLKEKIETLEKELKDIELSKAQSNEEEIKKLKQQLDDLQKKFNQKKEELNELNVQLIALQKEKGFLEKENREHLMSITSLKADFEEKLEEQNNTINILKTEKESLFEQLNNLQKELEEKNKFIETIQEESSKLKEENSGLNEKLTSLEKELQSLREFKSNAENQIIEQNTLISNLQKELNITREAKSALEETLFDLKEEVKTIQTNLEKEMKKNNTLEEQLKLAETKINKIKEIVSE